MATSSVYAKPTAGSLESGSWGCLTLVLEESHIFRLFVRCRPKSGNCRGFRVSLVLLILPREFEAARSLA